VHAIVICRDVSVCIEGRFLQWETLKDYKGRKGRGWRNDLLLVSPSFLERAKFYNGAGIHGTGARECCMLVSRDLSEND
jgi:hypothetical protein